jgi:hypothetical protein
VIHIRSISPLRDTTDTIASTKVLSPPLCPLKVTVSKSDKHYKSRRRLENQNGLQIHLHLQFFTPVNPKPFFHTTASEAPFHSPSTSTYTGWPPLPTPGPPSTSTLPAPSTNVYDLIVIGGGPAGEMTAMRATRGDLTALIIKCELVGGECPY